MALHATFNPSFAHDARLLADMGKLAPHVGTSAPTNLFVGRLWFDTTGGVAKLKTCTAISAEGTPTWV